MSSKADRSKPSKSERHTADVSALHCRALSKTLVLSTFSIFLVRTTTADCDDNSSSSFSRRAESFEGLKGKRKENLYMLRVSKECHVTSVEFKSPSGLNRRQPSSGINIFHLLSHCPMQFFTFLLNMSGTSVEHWISEAVLADLIDCVDDVRGAPLITFAEHACILTSSEFCFDSIRRIWQ